VAVMSGEVEEEVHAVGRGKTVTDAEKQTEKKQDAETESNEESQQLALLPGTEKASEKATDKTPAESKKTTNSQKSNFFKSRVSSIIPASVLRDQTWRESGPFHALITLQQHQMSQNNFAQAVNGGGVGSGNANSHNDISSFTLANARDFYFQRIGGGLDKFGAPYMLHVAGFVPEGFDVEKTAAENARMRVRVNELRGDVIEVMTEHNELEKQMKELGNIETKSELKRMQAKLQTVTKKLTQKHEEATKAQLENEKRQEESARVRNLLSTNGTYAKTSRGFEHVDCAENRIVLQSFKWGGKGYTRNKY
jgi:hypothetical protein